jgi:hypothetical protein
MRFVTLAVVMVSIGGLLSGGCDGAQADSCNQSREPLLRDPLREVQQSLRYQCGEPTPELETDPKSPDFGMASCSVIDGQSSLEHPDFCACEAEGYRPLNGDEYRAAEERSRSEGWCSDACCLNLCFCELKQLTGEDLHTCQYEGVRGGRNGWCYVAPNSGIGKLAAIERNDLVEATCDSPQAILFTGDYLDGIRYISCWR